MAAVFPAIPKFSPNHTHAGCRWLFGPLCRYSLRLPGFRALNGRIEKKREEKRREEKEATSRLKFFRLGSQGYCFLLNNKVFKASKNEQQFYYPFKTLKIIIMKKFVFFTTILVIFSVKSFTQQPDTTGNYFTFYDSGLEYFQQNADSSGILYYQVEGWKSFIRDVLFMKGKYDSYGNMTEYAISLDEYFSSITDNEPDILPVWEYIGHDELYPNFNSGNYSYHYGQGNISCIWVNQNNLNHIIAGGNRGSLWKTTNGGNNWDCISDTEPLLDGNRSIHVNNYKPDEIYIVQGTSKYTNGLFSTTNGGTSWNRNKVYVSSEALYLYPTATESLMPRKWIINPNNDSIMFLLTKGKVLRSLDGGSNWETLLSRDFDFWTHGQSFNDIEFDPADPSVIYVSGPEVYRLTLNGDSIQDISSNVLQWSINPNGCYKTLIGTQLAFPDTIWFAVNSWEGNDALLFYDKTLDRYGLLKQEPDLLDELKMQCEISPLNSNHISIGGLATYLYDHTTQTKYEISKYDAPTNWTHVDVRDIKYMHDGNGNEVLFYGNDGGVFRADPVDIDDWNWTYLANDGTNGIRNGHLHGFDCSNSSTDILYAGFQDMNSAIKINDQWYGTLGGDGGPGTIDKTDPNYMYFSRFNSPAFIYKSTNMWNDHELMLETESYSYPPIVLSPSNPNKLLVGDRCKIYIFNEVRQHNIYDSLTIIDEDGGAGRLDFEEIAISESNGDVIFASTGRYWPGWAIQPDTLIKSLYKSTDGGSTWVDISDNITSALHYAPITGIAINPWDENELWLSFGTVSSNTNINLSKKVYHSIDGGNNWTPMASGLPEKIPANEIVFDKRGGKLYLATDVGVYYYDEPEETWYNIINNAPSTHIGQIRFNYPKHKLRIGTHGHGIWQTDISVDSIITVYINDDTTWAKPQHPNANIIINSNATLTITSYVYMTNSTKIIVMPGGKLIINGGTISYGHGGLWGGIEVWGNPEATQIPANQGWLSISNGGTIEDAEVGVRVGAEDYANKGGGMVHTDSAFFRNNQTGVLYHDYAASNIGNFNLTTFETTAELVDGSSPVDLMKLVNVKGIQINGCAFRNTRGPTVAYSNRGKGITGIDATFFVDRLCISNSTPCTQYKETGFEDLLYGVYSIASTTIPYTDVRNTDFHMNKTGIYLSGITLARITENNFSVDHSQEAFVGLYLDQCTDYWVEGNMFEGNCIPGFTPCNEIGIVVNESGHDPNEIYRNEFNNLGYSILAQGLNRNPRSIAGEGLGCKCNEFTGNAYDIVVTGESSPYGIAQHQGSSAAQPDAPAGNRFSWTGPTGTDTDIDNLGLHFNYYYHVDPNYHLKPVYYDSLKINAEPAYNAPWDTLVSCPSYTDTTGGGGSTEEEFRGLLAESQEASDSLSGLIQALEDAGDTEALEWTVDMSVPEQSYEVYNQLMNTAPYISDTVMGAAIQKEDVLPDAMIRDVMVASPESAKDDALLEQLNQRINPPPAYMLAQILQGRSLVSVYGDLLAKQSYHNNRKAFAAKALERLYVNEPGNPAAQDSLTHLLQASENIRSQVHLAFLYMQQHDSASAVNTLAAIPANFPLDAQQLQEHAQLTAYLNQLMAMHGYLPDSTQSAWLMDAATEGNGMARTWARNLLLGLGQIEYNEPIILPLSTKSSPMNAYRNLNTMLSVPDQLEVHPNPASDHIIVKWELDTPPDALTLKVTTIDGKLIRETSLSGTTGETVIGTNHLLPGIYLVSIHNGTKIIESEKVSIN